MSREERFVRTTTGLMIGCRHIGAPPAQDADADLLQSALIDHPLPLHERVLDFVNRHTGRFMVMLAAVSIFLGVAFK